MIDYVGEYLIFLVSLFAIVNPMAVIPVFISLTSGQMPDHRRRVPLRTAITVFITLTAAYFIGEGLLRLFSTSIMALRIAGGLIIFRSAWTMLQPNDAEGKKIERQAHATQGSHGVAIVPLAIPLTAGPGAISLMIVAAGYTRGGTGCGGNYERIVGFVHYFCPLSVGRSDCPAAGRDRHERYATAYGPVSGCNRGRAYHCWA